MIGTKLRELREKAGLTQQELANRAGVSTGTVHRIETGQTENPDLPTLDKLARPLGVEVGVLAQEAVRPPQPPRRNLATPEDVSFVIDAVLKEVGKLSKKHRALLDQIAPAMLAIGSKDDAIRHALRYLRGALDEDVS